jgi:2'-5' RNA ligase
MMRLFVALSLPEPVCAALEAVMEGVAGARWQTDEQLHLTLRFLGEVDRHQAQDVHEALLALDHPGFRLAAAGVGHFEKRGTVHTLWAGVRPAEPVKVLHAKVDRLVQAAGITPDARAYVPHITLARLSGRVGELASFLHRHGALATPAWDVTDVCLYESTLTRAGAVYTVLERYPLTEPATTPNRHPDT